MQLNVYNNIKYQITNNCIHYNNINNNNNLLNYF